MEATLACDVVLLAEENENVGFGVSFWPPERASGKASVFAALLPRTNFSNSSSFPVEVLGS